MRPVDLLIVKDGSLRNVGALNGRLNAALQVLGTRLQYFGTNSKISVKVLDNINTNTPLPSGYDPLAGIIVVPPSPSPGAPVPPAPTEIFTTDLSSKDFTDELSRRVDVAGSRAGTFQPMTIVYLQMDQSAKAATINPDSYTFFSPNNFRAVFYFTAGINNTDAYSHQDVLELATNTGGNFTVSALAPDAVSGCEYDPDNNPNNNNNVKTNPNGFTQNDRTLKLAKSTLGQSGSVCAGTFSDILDKFAANGLGLKYFQTQMPEAAKPDSIRCVVLENGVEAAPIEDWRYWPGSTKLELSSSVAQGASVRCFYLPLAPSSQDPVANSGAGDPNVPETNNADTRSPNQKLFDSTVRGFLANDCSGCHGGRPFNTNDVYNSAKANIGEICRRLQLAPGSAGIMRPDRTGAYSATNLSALKAWATAESLQCP